MVGNPGEALWGANTKGEVWGTDGRVLLVCGAHVQKWAEGGRNLSYSGSAQGKMFRPSEKAVQRKGGLVWC